MALARSFQQRVGERERVSDSDDRSQVLKETSALNAEHFREVLIESTVDRACYQQDKVLSCRLT